MKTFLEFYQELSERQIQYNNNANYGQIVFFAGGSGSGKGFSTSNFIDSNKFKISDVDKLKKQMSRLPSLKAKYPEMEKLNLRNSEDVGKLHAIAKAEKLPERQLNALISGMQYPETLPNILFDITMRDLDQVNEYVPKLISLGYKAENIHITWVLTDYSVAVVRNRNRERVVPDDIMLKTHTGAALTIGKILQTKLPHSINGSVTIILNNPEEVTYYDRSDNSENELQLVKDFKYITVKKSKRPFVGVAEIDSEVRNTLYRWVKSNAPVNKNIEKMFS